MKKMDTRQIIIFNLILFSMLRLINGASLGNLNQFNEEFEDAEETHRTVLRNIQKNYENGLGNYEMADIENFINGFMTPDKQIRTSKTFFGPNKLLGPDKTSKDSSSHEILDQFRTNNAIESYVPDNLLQPIYKQNSYEISKSEREENSDFSPEMQNLWEEEFTLADIFPEVPKTSEGDELFETADYSVEDEMPELSKTAAEDQLEELSEMTGEADQDLVNTLSKATGDADNERLDELSETTDISDGHKIDIDEFQGSGDLSDSFADIFLTKTGLNGKSGRIMDFSTRGNSSAECTTPKGEQGHCRSLSQCPLSEALNNFNLFIKYVCLSRGVLVGICCPVNPVVEISDPTENSTRNSSTDFHQPSGGCGMNSNTRIVGGTISLPHEWTWMVALLRRNRFFCGGVIINDWYILTAAHCVMGLKVKDLKVRLGEYNFNEKNEHQEDLSVAEIKRHALFVTLTFQHDIALLKLKRRIEYTKFIGSICLPDPKSGNFSNANATVVGWGTEAFGGSASPILRQVTIPVWDNEECDKTYQLERITNAFMCAGSPKNGEDACQGDSGGPLMTVNNQGRWEVIGIVSWGRRCGDPTFPGVYTRVSSYLDWIAENTK